jgi:hypothetical protein
MFWVKVLELVVRQYHKRSMVMPAELSKCFSVGSFQPLGLDGVLNQLIAEGKIVTSEADLQMVFQSHLLKRNKKQKKNLLKAIWDSVLERFRY